MWLGGIYGSMVWGEFLKTRAGAVGDVIDRDIVFSFCFVSESFERGFGLRMAGQDDDYLFEGFSRSDKIWLKEETWVDLAWKKHIPALKELLDRMPPRDQGDIDRERAMIEKQGRLDDIIEKMSWEKMSIEEMEERILELKREVAEIDEVYLVGGGKDWPLARGGEGEVVVGDEGRVGGEGGGGEGDEELILM